MVDFDICKRCECCRLFDPPVRDENLRLERRASVECNVEGPDPVVLFKHDTVPKACLYAMEHLMSTETVEV